MLRSRKPEMDKLLIAYEYIFCNGFFFRLSVTIQFMVMEIMVQKIYIERSPTTCIVYLQLKKHIASA